jgi:ABC-type transport system involved in cytochrome bd biosynthesis fused ATPase/permease subunit
MSFSKQGLRNGFLGFDVANRAATIWDGGDKSFTLTNEKQLAQAVASVLQHPRETANQYIYVASVETTQKEILAALEEVTAAKWTVTDTTTDAEVSEAVKKLSAGDFSGAVALVRATSFGNTPGLRANYVKDEKLANDSLGLKLGSVKDTVKRVVSKPA